MAAKERKGENQKLKMLYLVKIFLEETDDQHALTMKEIIEKLESYGVSADRKTLYLDFAELRNFGLDIVAEKEGRNCYYSLVGRRFELPELKLLVDSVQSSKFITNKKSKELIKKLESLVSKHEAKQLQRQVVISGRIKSMNESIYYNVDRIHEAIGSDAKIRFRYFQWNLKKEMQLRRKGAFYEVSPWALMWEDENYYLIAYDSRDDKIKHYRVDKMLQISVLKQKREGLEQIKTFDMPRYTNRLFGMYGGEETNVTLRVKNELIGVMIDRFGKDILIMPVDENYFQTVVHVFLSNQFLGWILALGEGMKIIGPEKVVQSMRSELQKLAQLYQI